MDDKIEQISLSELIHILIKRKKLIAIVTAVFLLLGIAQTFVLTSTKYASELLLEINNIETTTTSPPPIGQDGAVFKILEGITHAGDMDFDAYLNEITSEDVLEKTIKDLGLEDKYSAADIKSALSISPNAELKNINLRLATKDPEESAKIINKLAENFTEHITELSQANSLHTLDIIKKQMEIEKEKYGEALKEYEKATKGVKSSYELELEMEAVYEQITLYKTNLNDLKVKKEGLTGALKSASASDSGGMIVRPSGGDSGYLYLDTSKKALEVDLAETNARIVSTEKSIGKMQESIEKLQTDYQDIEFAEGVIRQKVNLTKESYEAFAMKYEELSMQSSIDVGGISINVVAEAIPSSRPIGTSKVIKLAIFLMLGIMTGVILSFLQEYLEMMKAKKINKK